MAPRILVFDLVDMKGIGWRFELDIGSADDTVDS